MSTNTREVELGLGQHLHPAVHQRFGPKDHSVLQRSYHRRPDRRKEILPPRHAPSSFAMSSDNISNNVERLEPDLVLLLSRCRKEAQPDFVHTAATASAAAAAATAATAASPNAASCPVPSATLPNAPAPEPAPDQLQLQHQHQQPLRHDTRYTFQEDLLPRISSPLLEEEQQVSIRSRGQHRLDVRTSLAPGAIQTQSNPDDSLTPSSPLSPQIGIDALQDAFQAKYYELAAKCKGWRTKLVRRQPQRPVSRRRRGRLRPSLGAFGAFLGREERRGCTSASSHALLLLQPPVRGPLRASSFRLLSPQRLLHGPDGHGDPASGARARRTDCSLQPRLLARGPRGAAWTPLVPSPGSQSRCQSIFLAQRPLMDLPESRQKAEALDLALAPTCPRSARRISDPAPSVLWGNGRSARRHRPGRLPRHSRPNVAGAGSSRCRRVDRTSCVGSSDSTAPTSKSNIATTAASIVASTGVTKAALQSKRSQHRLGRTVLRASAWRRSSRAPSPPRASWLDPRPPP
ncbi:hypothetical protein L1887_57702 [Cichorium endivia]|nr:hypothetical protein L1887_57702 [Cichorium endivia]